MYFNIECKNRAKQKHFFIKSGNFERETRGAPIFRRKLMTRNLYKLKSNKQMLRTTLLRTKVKHKYAIYLCDKST